MKLSSIPSFIANLITLIIIGLPSNGTSILENTARIPFRNSSPQFKRPGICGIEGYSTVCNEKQEVDDCICGQIVGGTKVICREAV